MGERSFRELFKRLIGVSPKEYISEMRIKNAEELLLTTSMSIKEISASLGFSNQYYFSNFFKKKKGGYPEAFRNTFGGV
ncbi:MAG: AraC family transcriptional regulator [Clostridia bacterium]|nr:AraC family transcriptional regulator [Clostridia bacterium]